MGREIGARTMVANSAAPDPLGRPGRLTGAQNALQSGLRGESDADDVRNAAGRSG